MADCSSPFPNNKWRDNDIKKIINVLANFMYTFLFIALWLLL